MYFWIPGWPEKAGFLDMEEKTLLLARLNADTGDAVMDRLDKNAAKRIFSDPKIYLGTLAYFGVYPQCYSILHHSHWNTC